MLYMRYALGLNVGHKKNRTFQFTQKMYSSKKLVYRNHLLLEEKILESYLLNISFLPPSFLWTIDKFNCQR